MIRCDDRNPLLEEPFAQTLSGKRNVIEAVLGKRKRQRRWWRNDSCKMLERAVCESVTCERVAWDKIVCGKSVCVCMADKVLCVGFVCDNAVCPRVVCDRVVCDRVDQSCV